MSSNLARKAGILVAGGGVYAATVFSVYTYMKMSQPSDESSSTSGFSYVSNPLRNQQYNKVASCYDEQIGKQEFFMGINLLRRSLLYFHCQGTVLEVGAGTARNLKYYLSSNTVQRVFLSDQSDPMLAQARQKIAALSPEQQKRFAVLTADAEMLNLPANSFDTVVDSFGLCSYDDPVTVLKEMARVVKPNGKVLLLEHGRSKDWDFVTTHLDKHAEDHAKRWGCVWNRDLDDMLERSGLQVESLHKWHFGSTYYVVCRPKIVDEDKQ